MPPRVARDHMTDRAWRDVEQLGKLPWLGCSSNSSYLKYFILTQFTSRVQFPDLSWRTLSRSTAAFTHAITVVVSDRTNPQVVWTHATAIVARMAHATPSRNRTVSEFPCDAVSTERSATASVAMNSTVPISRNAATPDPAIGRFCNFLPKPIKRRVDLIRHRQILPLCLCVVDLAGGRRFQGLAR